MEVSFQTAFRFLPGFLKNFGMIANATFIDSDAAYTQSGPAIAPGGALVPVTRTETLYGLSKRAYNGTLYYEDSRFSARGSISYRGPYIDGGSGTGNIFEGYNASLNVDASIRYKITPNIEVSIEGTNLTDDYRDRYTDLDADRNYEYNHFGRTFLIGARFKM
jgi:TonB-dependent receptor